MFEHYKTVKAIPIAVFRHARPIIDAQGIETCDASKVIAKAILNDWHNRLVPLEEGKSQQQVLEDIREKVEKKFDEVPRPSQPDLDQSAVRLIHASDLKLDLRKIS